MSLITLSAGDEVTSDWTDGVTRFGNNMLQTDSAAANANLSLTGSFQDISGATVTVNPQGNSAIVFIVAIFAFRATVSSAGAIMIGQIVVDGVAQPNQALLIDNGANTRATVAQSCTVAVAAGARTIKLQAQCGSGTHQADQQHTIINVLLIDIP